MSPVSELARRYYDEFAGRGSFATVAMDEGLRFRGPIHAYDDGERYRRECVELAARVTGFEIRHQFVDGDRVHTVYDIDLGLPSGPIATSETLTYRDGVMVAADLIIDSAPLRAPAEP